MDALNRLAFEALLGVAYFVIAMAVLARVDPLPVCLSSDDGQPGAVEQDDLAPVVVVTSDVPALTRLTDANVARVWVPKSVRQAGVATDVREVEDGLALASLWEREQVQLRRVSRSECPLERQPGPGHAVTIPMRTEAAVGGYVVPGSCVDVFGTFPTPRGPATRAFLQRRRVLAINIHASAYFGAVLAPVLAGGRSAVQESLCCSGEGLAQWDNVMTVTLEVSAGEAEKLTLAAGSHNLSLAIANPFGPEEGPPAVITEEALWNPVPAERADGLRGAW